MKNEYVLESAIKYSEGKKYQIKIKTEEHYHRIDISNLKDSINLNIYNSGKMVVGGKNSELKKEYEKWVAEINENPSILFEEKIKKALGIKYTIIVDEIREEIKEKLNELGEVDIYERPTDSEMYRAKISSNDSFLTLTQYSNGTLFIQGRESILIDMLCDLIEKIARPSDHDVVIRFISGDENAIKSFSSKFTLEILQEAENNCRNYFGVVFDFLDSHDQKWLVASEIFKIANLPLPEYSPLVMPASKAFEGFAKKILVNVGFYPPDHFKEKGATFAYINDFSHPTRKSFCQKEKIADTILKDINVCIDKYRNFMMHSDDNKNTKVESYEQAVKILEEIYGKIKYFYEYFKKNNEFGF